MTLKTSHTAILLFAHTSAVDAAHKAMPSINVMDVLNQQALKTIKQSGFDYFHFTEREQHGDSFATRFTNSIQDVFDLGYESVICLGNDTPLLTTNLIHKAAKNLHNGHAVKGKSHDGGLYLIGMNRAHFNAQKFENLPWQTAQLAISFHHYMNDYDADLVVLKTLQDVDSAADLQQFLAGKKASILVVKFLFILLSRKQNNHIHKDHYYLEVVVDQPQNKGSPVLQAA